jgi:hypothetical protein
MNLIFKIVEYLEETEQIVVKFCRQNAPKPIDEYPPVAIDCINLDLYDYHQFVASLMKYGVEIIMQQEAEETTLPQNITSEVIEDHNIKTQLNRIICLNSSELTSTTYKMNKIELE